jgi:hypothetical protein
MCEMCSANGIRMLTKISLGGIKGRELLENLGYTGGEY